MLKLTSSRQEGTGTTLLHELPSPRIKALSYIGLRDKRLLASYGEKGRRCRPSFLLMFQLLRKPSGVELICLALWVLSAGLCIHCLISSFSSSSLPYLSLSLVAIFSCEHGSSRIQSEDLTPLSPPLFLPQFSPPTKCRRANSGGITPENSAGYYKVCLHKTSATFPLRIAPAYGGRRERREKKIWRRSVKDYNIKGVEFSIWFYWIMLSEIWQIHSGKSYPEMAKFKKYYVDFTHVTESIVTLIHSKSAVKQTSNCTDWHFSMDIQTAKTSRHQRKLLRARQHRKYRKANLRVEILHLVEWDR